mmetsp:Transcript_24953/g.69587  ORF Transcript_24953/g.69587 Transcript_24953/m.69587 type:complete len:272 (+) Transcript_24953:191-1006(+)|eukprot:CAMPEP_0117661998 /NCGR_PEP_ID=MMETSP0804-20121206/7828_1 /TAXON_ID=1074897 /ORGANISM="Tetraselmis astigmatica, Strain CCMP880" /LENGTH=271 /DNA_ID=CAMNT_0005468887 /DNA_START=129 /DNA_END=944 /DNA_ORIENTATION=-
MKHAQVVIGPAGCGKSTYCKTMKTHCDAIGRAVHCVNMDPAAEHFGYPVSFDVRDLVTLEDVMEEMQLGPNGGLLYCMEFLEENLDDWLAEQLESYGEEDYLIFDCPGQIELYSHVSMFRNFIKYLEKEGWSVCCVYVIDAQFVTDIPKFVAGTFQAMSAMVHLETPHINVLSKMDLIPNKEDIHRFLVPDSLDLMHLLGESTAPRFRRLNDAVVSVIEDVSLVSYVPLDISDEESISDALIQIDMAFQYGEDTEVKIREFDPEDDDDEEE